jgi:hypothetical protein
MLNLLIKYPGQVDSDPNYLWGKPRNRSTADAHDGHPYEASWVADVYGFMQSLLHGAGITPSGNPDTATNSDCYSAIWELIRRRVSTVNDFGIWVTGSGTLVVSGGGALSINTGGTCTFTSGSTTTFSSSSVVNFNGATVTFNCNPVLANGANLNINSGADIELNSGGDFNVNSGGDLDVHSGGDINILSGGKINVSASGEINFAASTYPQLASTSLRHTFTGDLQAAEGTSWLLSATYGIQTALFTAGTLMARSRVQAGGATISEVSIYFKGPTHGGSWPPQFPARIAVYKKANMGGGGAATLLGSKTDDTAQGVYETYHEIKVDGLSATFDPGEELMLVFYGEYGTLALAGTEVHHPTYAMTHTDIRPGG